MKIDHLLVGIWPALALVLRPHVAINDLTNLWPGSWIPLGTWEKFADFVTPGHCFILTGSAIDDGVVNFAPKRSLAVPYSTSHIALKTRITSKNYKRRISNLSPYFPKQHEWFLNLLEMTLFSNTSMTNVVLIENIPINCTTSGSTTYVLKIWRHKITKYFNKTKKIE